MKEKEKERKEYSLYTLYTDGSSHGNPGPAGAGIVITDGNKIILKKSIPLGEKTNNEAEYLAFLLGLKEAHKLGLRNLTIRTDSKLIVGHLKGIYKLRSKRLKGLCFRIKKELRFLVPWRIEHIRRQENKLADRLANLAAESRKHRAVEKVESYIAQLSEQYDVEVEWLYKDEDYASAQVGIYDRARFVTKLTVSSELIGRSYHLKIECSSPACDVDCPFYGRQFCRKFVIY